MPKLNFPQIPSSEITSKQVYLSRREFMRAAGVIAGSVALTACAPSKPAAQTSQRSGGDQRNNLPVEKDELGDPTNSFEDITHYNNYYEFSEEKEGVAPLAANFKTSPWDVEVSGLVNNPKTYSVDDLIKKFQPEERIYRLRSEERRVGKECSCR